VTLEDKIRLRFEDARTPQEYAKVIYDLGFELMDSGELDSDELVWEVARTIWGRGAGFEALVYAEFEKLI
jgi:RimJ/RimL family protein N-acetyltransferase